MLLSGSRAHGIEDEHSDYDLKRIHRTDEAAARHPPGHRGPLDFDHLSLSALRRCVEETGWWTPGYAYARILLDKTGEIADALARVPAPDPAEHYDAYLNSFVRSTRAWERGDELGARISAGESLAWLAKALFALEGRVAPYHDYLFVHLADEWLPAFGEIARTADAGAQRALQERVQALMEARGIRKHEEWGERLERARGAA